MKKFLSLICLSLCMTLTVNAADVNTDLKIKEIEYNSMYTGNQSVTLISPQGKLTHYFKNGVYTVSVADTVLGKYSVTVEGLENANEEYKAKGFKGVPVKQVSNFYDKNAWVCQYETGKLKEVNCVPTSLNTCLNLMKPEEFSGNYVSKVRKVNTDTAYTKTEAIQEMFANNLIPVMSNSKNEIMNLIDNGSIGFFFCTTKSFENSSNTKIGIPLNSGGTGDHCVLITGYTYDQDGKLYFEIVDPSWRKVEKCQFYITEKQLHDFQQDYSLIFASLPEKYSTTDTTVYTNGCINLRRVSDDKIDKDKVKGAGDKVRQMFVTEEFAIYYQIGDYWYKPEIN